MGKKNKNKKKGRGAEKTVTKTEKNVAAKQKKMLEKLGEADITEVVHQLELEQARQSVITEDVCSPPSPRSSFSLVAHPEKEELILFGGEFFNGTRVCIYNDLFFYNISKNEWKQVRSPNGPTERSGHQMVTVATDGGQLWLFGGEHASPSQLQFFHYKDLWSMNLKTRKWEKVNATNGPSARSGHRMVATKKRLIVFGGFHDNNQSYQYYNDVHVFSLESYVWQNINVLGAIPPAPRSGCCIAASPDGKVLIWGGYSRSPMKNKADRGVTHTDMYALIPDKKNFENLKWNLVKIRGYVPLPRSSVGYCSAPNGKAYCFGGVMDVNENEEDVMGQFGEDLLSLDVDTQTWRLLKPHIKAQVTKITESNQTLANNDVEIDTTKVNTPTVSTDGIFTISVAGPSKTSNPTLEPGKIPSLFPNRRATNVPPPRMNAGLCVSKGNLYLFGGLYEEGDKQFTFNDFYAIDLHKLDEWKVIIPNDMDAHEWINSESSDSEEEDTESEDDTESEEDSDESDMDID